MPELIEIVEIPLPGCENMYNDVAVVQQQPAGVYCAFMVVWGDALFLQVQFYFVIYRTELPLVVAGADNEIVGKTAYFTGIQQHDIGCLFFTGDVHGGMGYFDCFQ